MKYLILLITLGLASAKAETGVASFYRVRTNGTVTASGIPLKDAELTAAHKTLPFGTKVLVRCLRTNKKVIVKITDRGPFIKGRIIDLSYAAANKIDLVSRGITSVEISTVK